MVFHSHQAEILPFSTTVFKALRDRLLWFYKTLSSFISPLIQWFNNTFLMQFVGFFLYMNTEREESRDSVQLLFVNIFCVVESGWEIKILLFCKTKMLLRGRFRWAMKARVRTEMSRDIVFKWAGHFRSNGKRTERMKAAGWQKAKISCDTV